MGASLLLTVTESSVNQAKNTSVVNVSVAVKSTGGIYNTSARPGTIVIDGSSYSFTHGFASNTTTKLASKSKTVTHNTDGTKKVTVKVTYKTGTSAGNITASKTITLTSIKRQFKVVLNSGSGTSTKTKQYGTNLALPTPAKTGYTFGGWCTGTNGSGTNYHTTYTANADITLYAKWTINTYTLTANANGGTISSTSGWSGTGSKSTKSITYNSAYGTLPTPTRTGYTFQEWYTAASSGSPISSSTKIGTSNVTIYAHWKAIESTVTYNGNGNTGGSAPSGEFKYTYDSLCNIQKNLGDDKLVKEYYIFKGWSTNPNAESAQYLAGSRIKWNNPNINVTLYAVWAPDTAKITYYRNSTEKDFDKTDSYVELSSTIFKKVEINYTVENISAPNLLDYTFSGKWTLNKPNSIVYTEYGVSFPAGIIPYDYDETSLTIEDGFYESGDIVYNVTEPLDFYPVYRDNTKSLVSLFNTTYNYVPSNVNESTYFSYISDQLSIISISTTSDYVLTGCIFKTETGASGVSIDTSDVQASLVSTSVVSPPATISLNPVFMKSIYNSVLDISTIYIIYKNSSALQRPEDANYRLSISDLKDSFGKVLPTAIVNIYPPKVLRDINANGDVIAFFTNAPDYSPAKEEKEIFINGNIMLGLYNYDKSTYTDYKLYNSINSLGWVSAVIEDS